MSKTNNIKKDRGFTIVELLVVIVVIGILAAITIVSYTGITARANLASAQSAANALQAKSEVYYADGPTSQYPVTFSVLTADSSKTYYTSGVTISATALAAAPASPSVLNFWKCGFKSGQVAAPSLVTDITNFTGNKIYYWDYTTNAITTTPVLVGNTSTAVSTYNVACFISAT